MPKRIMGVLVSAATLAGLFLGFPLSAQAFAISPLRYTLTIDQGASQIIVITINNPDPIPRLFRIGITGVIPDNQGRPILQEHVDDAESWATPESSEIALPARGQKKVAVTIAVPAGVLPGEHRFGVTVEPISSSHGTAVLVGRLVTLVKLFVAGEVREAIAITAWHAPSLVTNASWDLTGELKNIGTVAVPLKGTVTITNWHGESLTPESIILGNELLPGAVRQLHPTITIPTTLRPGLYRVAITVTYGQTGNSVARTLSLWYLPPRSLYLITFLGALIIGMGIILRYRFKKS